MFDDTANLEISNINLIVKDGDKHETHDGDHFD